jgi:FkbM family methyltransferase
LSTPSFSVRPTSFTPISALAYCCTRLGPRLQRRFGKYGFNHQARLLNADRFHPTIRAVADDCVFEFPALDHYFAEMFIGGGYETELYAVLEALAKRDYCLIDAGANLGYWSVLASGARLGRQQVIAVEASPQTFSLLQRNVGLNGNRFVAVHAAVHERSGDVLAFDDVSEHATRKVLADQAASLPSTVVVSVAIDDLAARFAPDAGAFVVKLDVEGAELAALFGASRLLQDRDVLLLVEDHGSDRTHAVTTHLLDQGLEVHFLQPDAEPIRITRPSQLDDLKSDVGRGYNISGHRQSSTLASAAGLANHVHNRDGHG